MTMLFKPEDFDVTKFKSQSDIYENPWKVRSSCHMEVQATIRLQMGTATGLEKRSYDGRNHSGMAGCTVNVLVSHAANCIGRFSLGLGSYGPVKTTKD